MKDKIMQKCDEQLEKITEEVSKENNLKWEESAEIVDNCFTRLCSKEYLSRLAVKIK